MGISGTKGRPTKQCEEDKRNIIGKGSRGPNLVVKDTRSTKQSKSVSIKENLKRVITYFILCTENSACSISINVFEASYLSSGICFQGSPLLSKDWCHLEAKY